MSTDDDRPDSAADAAWLLGLSPGVQQELVSLVRSLADLTQLEKLELRKVVDLVKGSALGDYRPQFLQPFTCLSLLAFEMQRSAQPKRGDSDG